MATAAAPAPGPETPPPTGVALYMLNYFRARGTLEAQRDNYNDLASDVLTPAADAAVFAAAALDITDHLGHLKDEHDAFMRTFGPTVSPPSNAVIQKSTSLSKAVGADIAKANTAVALLHIVTQFVTDWGTLSGVPTPRAQTSPALEPAQGIAAPQSALNLSFLKAKG